MEMRIRQAYNERKSYCNYRYNTAARATSSLLYDGTKICQAGYDKTERLFENTRMEIVGQGVVDGMAIVIDVMS